MRETVKKVADLIRDLVTLNLLKAENVTTKLTQYAVESSLVVKIVVKESDLFSCIALFEELKGEAQEMTIIENNRENSMRSILVVEYRSR